MKNKNKNMLRKSVVAATVVILCTGIIIPSIQAAGSYTTGSVLFGGSGGEISEDNTNLTWDNSSKRLGIGTASPLSPLHIKSNDPILYRLEGTCTTADPSFFVESTNAGQAWRFSVSRVNGQFVFTDNTNSKYPFKINANTPTNSFWLKTTECAINENSQNYDFRVESDNNANMLFVDALTDRVGIGTNSPSTTLDVAGTVEMTGFKMPTGVSSGYVLTSDANGVGTWQPGGGGGGIGGSGTANYIPKFTGSTTLGNSVLYETGGNIGIGTTSPGATLDVRGDAVFNDDGGNYDLRVEGMSEENLLFVDASSGRVGIGTNSPSKELDIAQTKVGSDVTLNVWNKDNTNPGSDARLVTMVEGSSAGDAYASFGLNGGPWWSLGQDNSDYDTFKISYGTTLGTYDRVTISTGGRVGIGTTSPGATLDVRGDAVFNDDGGDNDFRVEGTMDGNLFFIDASADEIGIGTNDPLTRLHIGDGGFLITGKTGWTPMSGAGQRLMWIPATAAFRAGYVSGSHWDDGNIGVNSTALGCDTIASGGESIAMGYNTLASGDRSTAMGGDTYAKGDRSTAMGSETVAWEEYSTAMGYITNASGIRSTALGSWSRASGENSTAMGWNTLARGSASTAMGFSTTAWGENSTAMGIGTNASGIASTAMGIESTASGQYATAMGCGTTASANTATAMGLQTIAYGSYSTAMGYQANASGIASTAMGYKANASGDQAVAMGTFTDAEGSQAVAMGYDTNASGSYAIAMGRTINVSGFNSVGIGLDGTHYTISTSNVMCVLGGRVGIGTNNPGAELEVDGTTMTNILQLDKLTSAPGSPADGMVVYADGSSWNPGSGEGIYAYYSSGWHYLG